MQKDTGKEALDGTGKPITAKTQFTPENPDGTLLGDAVVFEEFVMIGEGGRQVVVGEHKDLKDAAQTVSLYTDKTTSRRTTSPARTGDDSNSMMWIIIGAVALTLKLMS